MKINTISNQEQNNSKPLEIQKIEKQILFGAAGPWTKHFKALLFFGIDVSRLYIENEKLRNHLKDREDTISLLEDLLQDKVDKLKIIDSIIHKN